MVWWYGVCCVINFKLLRFMWHCKWYGGFHLPSHTSFINVHQTNHLHFSLQHSHQVYMLDAHQLLAGQKSGEFWCSRNFLFQQVCNFTHH
jgi:hypothetical protein